MGRVIMAVVGLFFLMVTSAYAQVAVLDLTSIGTYDTTGTYYTTYEYTGENPTLVGVATASSDVVITIDGLAEIVTADVDGVWIYTPTNLLAGEYDFEISSEGEALAFTLTITEGATTGKGGVAVPGEEELLDSGVEEYTYIIAFAGLFALISAGVLATVKTK